MFEGYRRQIARIVADLDGLPPPPLGDDTSDLIRELERLLNLLRDPHPGLATWNMLCEDAAQRIERALQQARVPVHR